VVLSENGNTSSPDGSNAYITVGGTAATGSAQGTNTTFGPTGINLMNPVSLNSHQITPLAAGTISSTSAEAVNGSASTSSPAGATDSSEAHNDASSMTKLTLGSTESTTPVRLSSVANSTAPTNAVGASQLLAATTGDNPYIQVGGMNDGTDYAYATPLNNGTAIGPTTTATAAGGVAIGTQALALSGTGAMAVGMATTASGSGSLAMGYSALASNIGSTAVGYGAIATGTDSISMGSLAKAMGAKSMALGYWATAAADQSMAFGMNTNIDGQATSSIAIGVNAKITSNAPNSIALGTSSVADRANSVSVGSTNLQRQIVNVANGTGGTDAVNVSQLTAAVSVFGGGATVGTTGSIVNPAYLINGKTYYDVGSALAAVGGDGTNPLAVQYDDTSLNKVTLGGDATHAPVVVTNVANGALAASSVDAVNGSQLYALGAKTNASGDITNAFVAYDDTSMAKVTLGGERNAALCSGCDDRRIGQHYQCVRELRRCVEELDHARRRGSCTGRAAQRCGRLRLGNQLRRRQRFAALRPRRENRPLWQLAERIRCVR
jgi:autotransporter adhesin